MRFKTSPLRLPLLSLLVALAGCSSLTQTTAQLVASGALCDDVRTPVRGDGILQAIPEASYDSELDTPETVESVRTTNGEIVGHNAVVKELCPRGR
jgi:hypothetical protein